MKCVEELKKEVKIRKKIEYCTFEEFSKEDKLLLMIKILSNNEILSYLYDKIFYKRNLSNHLVSSVKHEKDGCLPRISFNLAYEKGK